MRRKILVILNIFFIYNYSMAYEFYYTAEIDEDLNTAIYLTTLNEKYTKIFEDSYYLILKSISQNKIAHIPVNLSYKGGKDLWAVGVIPFYEDWQIVGSDHKDGKSIKSEEPIFPQESFIKLSPDRYLDHLDKNNFFRFNQFLKCVDRNYSIDISTKLIKKEKYLFVVTFSENEGLIKQYYGEWKNNLSWSCNRSIKNVEIKARTFNKLYIIDK